MTHLSKHCELPREWNIWKFERTTCSQNVCSNVQSSSRCYSTRVSFRPDYPHRRLNPIQSEESRARSGSKSWLNNSKQAGLEGTRDAWHANSIRRGARARGTYAWPSQEHAGTPLTARCRELLPRVTWAQSNFARGEPASFTGCAHAHGSVHANRAQPTTGQPISEYFASWISRNFSLSSSVCIAAHWYTLFVAISQPAITMTSKLALLTVHLRSLSLKLNSSLPSFFHVSIVRRFEWKRMHWGTGWKE